MPCWLLLVQVLLMRVLCFEYPMVIPCVWLYWRVLLLRWFWFEDPPIVRAVSVVLVMSLWLMVLSCE